MTSSVQFGEFCYPGIRTVPQSEGSSGARDLGSANLLTRQAVTDISGGHR